MFKILIILIVTTLTMPLFAKELKIAFHAGNAPPFAITKNNYLVSGIMRDIGDELGRILKVNIKYWRTTRGRVEEDINSGRIDLLIKFNPAWSSDKTMHHWSIPIFKEKNVFVTRVDSRFEVEGFKTLKGKRVGTIFKYRYKDIEAHFKKGTIVRDDVYEIGQNFERLERGMIDTLLDSDILIGYYLKKNGRYGDFAVSPFILSEHNIYSILSKRSKLSIENLNRAYEQMMREGTIEQILNKYR